MSVLRVRFNGYYINSSVATESSCAQADAPRDASRRPPRGGRAGSGSPLAREESVAARRQLARPGEQRLDLGVERLRLDVAPALRPAPGEVLEARQQIADLEQVLVREEEIAPQPGAGTTEDEPALEEARERLAVRLEDGAELDLIIAEAAMVARVGEVDDRRRPLRPGLSARRERILPSPES
jgi:hypothetical protein